MKRILLAFLPLLIGAPAWANNCPSYTYTLTNGTNADATQVMGNFNTIMNCASFLLAAPRPAALPLRHWQPSPPGCSL
jgi:hypothetical protein